MVSGKLTIGELLQVFVEQGGTKIDRIEKQRDDLRHSLRSLSCDLAVFCKSHGCDRELSAKVAYRFFASLYNNLALGDFWDKNFTVRQKKSWVASGSGSFPSE